MPLKDFQGYKNPQYKASKDEYFPCYWGWSEAESILKDIKDISFPCLLELNLNGNNIASIEALIFADYPNLKSLNLK